MKMGIKNNYQTHNAQALKSVLKDAMVNKKMIGVIGHSGAGKSRSLNMYRSKISNIFLMSLGVSVTPKEMYRRIYRALTSSLHDPKLTTADLMIEIRNRVRNIPGNKVIIIDEAGHFTKDKVAYFQELYNLIAHECGIVLMGPEHYETNIENWASLGIQGVEEFKSRISYFITLNRPQDDELEFLLPKEGFDIEGADKSLYDRIQEIPRNKLTWRMVSHIIDDYELEKAQKNDE